MEESSNISFEDICELDPHNREILITIKVRQRVLEIVTRLTSVFGIVYLGGPGYLFYWGYPYSASLQLLAFIVIICCCLYLMTLEKKPETKKCFKVLAVILITFVGTLIWLVVFQIFSTLFTDMEFFLLAIFIAIKRGM